MQIELPSHLIAKLQGLPEQGMGYQRVRVRLQDGSVWHNALVFNCSVLEVPAGTELSIHTPIRDVDLEDPA